MESNCPPSFYSEGKCPTLYTAFFHGEKCWWPLNFDLFALIVIDRGRPDVVFADTSEVYWCLQLDKNRQTSRPWEKKKIYDEFREREKNWIEQTLKYILYVKLLILISVGGEHKNCWVQCGSAGSWINWVLSF